MRLSENRIAAVCAFAGAALLALGTVLHPGDADPNNAAAAFAEYAASRQWIAIHLIQFAGVAAMTAALLVLCRQLEAGALPRLAAGGAVASLALAAALQAVDGIALKAMVDAWAAAPPAEKNAAFRAAFAVRQIEIGFASLSSLVFGATAMLYGAALLTTRAFPAWLGWLATAAGFGMAAAGLAIAYTGFSDLEMLILMPASLLLLAWMAGLGAMWWRAKEEGAARH
ncbi:MAG: hypothetical protein QOF19_1387 [Alphaproteobacteria bacterium]|jgi:hypothetical protein|nr:hypothetical protein [Alphaproteobacteria bacterium]